MTRYSRLLSGLLLLIGLGLLTSSRPARGWSVPGAPPCPHEVPGQGMKDCDTQRPCELEVTAADCAGLHWIIAQWPLKCISDPPSTNGKLCNSTSDVCGRQKACVWDPNDPIPCSTAGTAPKPQRDTTNSGKLVQGDCGP
jgi:hypothetical protein